MKKQETIESNSPGNENQISGNSSNGKRNSNKPQTEVSPVNKRRRFTYHYKKRILTEIDNAEPGKIGDILRREGIHRSYADRWRISVAMHERKNSEPTKKQIMEQVDLQKENARLRRKLREAEIIIDAQKKMAEIFGIQDE